ncbi:LysR family transcriptional regulator [Demequina gelatinilytica]|uniref:LysR family transcriptional regulator n=1 Tax=Demequina gelatinilytica TaxID=1638980 RepID=UPI000784F87A|nr:LysR family transcriptional regulator [Demequina gelatinilytica]
MLDLTRLVALRELALRGTIAAAADALGYTASAVSQQVAALERETGVRLTIRAGRRLVLTPAGERLVARTHDLLDTMEIAEAELHAETEGVTGTVRLAVFQSAALTLVTGALLRLRETHPDIRVKVTQTEPEEAFADTWAREYDLVVAEEYPQHSAPHYPGVVRRPLVRDELLLAVGGEWAGATSVAELATAPWVMEPPGTATRHFAEQTCRLAGFEPDVRFASSDLQAHVQLVQKGLAVAILPGLMVAYARIDARVIPLDGGPRRTVFAAMRATSRLDPAVEAVRLALEAEGGLATA